MSTSRESLHRTLLVVFAGITSVALLIGAIALLIREINAGERETPAPRGNFAIQDPVAPARPTPGGPAVPGVPAGGPVAVPAGMKITPGVKRFTLRLGQGFRFKDGIVVIARDDDRPDVVFKYLSPKSAGMSMRFNPLSGQLEHGFEPVLNSPVPLLVGTHISPFDEKPNLARTTSGDMAGFGENAPIGSKTRYVLLQTQSGEQYLLTLDELEAVPDKYDDWRIGFAYEAVQLPVGLAGGKINSPLPGKLIFRDWSRTKMVMRVNLTTGRQEAVVDGILPSAVGDRLLGYGDTSSAYIVRDEAGKTLSTIRFDEQVLGPQLSPDGTRLAGSVFRAGPETKIGAVTVPGAAVPSVAVFDLSGREIVSIAGYDDAAWTPDGKLVATGRGSDPGLFEIDPATKQVTAIDARIACPGQPTVSPDGKTIAFITGGRIWLIGRDGKNLRQVFPDGRSQQRPAFSPDGTKIAAVICNMLANDTTGEVFVIDLKTGEITPLRTNTGLSLIPDPSSKLNWVP